MPNFALRALRFATWGHVSMDRLAENGLELTLSNPYYSPAPYTTLRCCFPLARLKYSVTSWAFPFANAVSLLTESEGTELREPRGPRIVALACCLRSALQPRSGPAPVHLPADDVAVKSRVNAGTSLAPIVGAPEVGMQFTLARLPLRGSSNRSRPPLWSGR